MSNNASENLESVIVSIAIEMKSAVVALAGERGDSDTKDSMIARAARAAGITYRQARGLYYGEIADPKYSVVERVRSAMARKRHDVGQERAEAALNLLNIVDRLDRLDPDGSGEAVFQTFGPAGESLLEMVRARRQAEQEG